MAAQARSHIVLHEKFGRGGVLHVAVAGGATDFGAGVRRVLELNQGLARKAVDPLPWYLPAAIGKGCQLLDLRFSGGDLGVTEHTFANRGNCGGRARVGKTVAIEALQSEIDMLPVGIRNRLIGCRYTRVYSQNAEDPHASFSLPSAHLYHRASPTLCCPRLFNTS